MTAVGASGFPILMDTFVRVTKSPVVSIAKIRGCVRGVSSEFVLACDMRFASRENTLLGQPEVGVGLHPEAAVRNVFHIWSVAVGRSKSFSARTISTATPRNDTDTSTGHFQTPNWTASSTRSRRRIASFDRRAIAAAKNLVNHVSLPSADRLLAAITSFETALTWPETQQRIQALLKRGLQRDGDFEYRCPQCSTHCSRHSHLVAMCNPRRANRAVPFQVEISQAALDAERRQTMSYCISTLLTRNLHDVFGENDAARRRAAIDEIFTEDAVFYEPRGIHHGRDEIDRVAGAIKATHPDFRYQPIARPRKWAMRADPMGIWPPR